MKFQLSCLAVSVFGVFSISTVAAAELPATKLNVIGGISVTTQHKLLEKPFWTKRLSAASKGRVTAEIKAWNEMGLKGPEVFRLVRRGVADAATGFLGHMAGDIPMNEGVDLAGLNPTYSQFEKAVAAFRPLLADHYKNKHGMVILGMWSYQAQVLVCKNELKSLTDLKGRKVRTSGASQADFVSYFGGSGVPIPFGEVQQGLVNGVIDCAISGTLGIYKAKWWEGAKHMYPLPVTWGAMAFAINARKWSKLDPAVQTFLKKEIAGLEADIWKQNAAEHQEGIDCNTGTTCKHGKPAGMKLAKIPDGDKALRRKALLEAVLPAWAKRCGAACVNAWNGTVGKLHDLKAIAK